MDWDAPTHPPHDKTVAGDLRLAAARRWRDVITWVVGRVLLGGRWAGVFRWAVGRVLLGGWGVVRWVVGRCC